MKRSKYTDRIINKFKFTGFLLYDHILFYRTKQALEDLIEKYIDTDTENLEEFFENNNDVVNEIYFVQGCMRIKLKFFHK